MKKLLLATIATVALTTGSALAADLARPYYKAAPPPPPPVASWTGCYIDGGVGYGMWNQDSYTETDPGHVPLSVTSTLGGRGWLGRLGAGCDYQIASSWVIGVFGDYDFAHIHGNYMEPLTGFTGDENLSGQWAVGGRIGYLVTPSLLGYVDGGYTEARFDAVALGPLLVGGGPTGLSIGSHTYNGWFIGGGTEYALGGIIPINGLFWRTEYRYSSFGSTDLPITCGSAALCGAVGPTGLADHVTKYEQTVTSGLVWRFNFGGPIGTRY